MSYYRFTKLKRIILNSLNFMDFHFFRVLFWHFTIIDSTGTIMFTWFFLIPGFLHWYLHMLSKQSLLDLTGYIWQRQSFQSAQLGIVEMWPGRPLGRWGLPSGWSLWARPVPELWSGRVYTMAGQDCWLGSLAKWGFWRGLCGCLGTVLVSSCGYELACLLDLHSRMDPRVSTAHCLRT